MRTSVSQDVHQSGYLGGTTHSVVISLRLSARLCVDKRLKREACAERALNRATGRTGQVTKLVRSTDDERPEGARTELHQVNGNHTPCALHAELFEKGGGNDGFAGGECVRVEESTADGADDNDGKATAELLGEVAYDCAAGHCSGNELA